MAPSPTKGTAQSFPLPDDARLAEAERIQKRGRHLFATATAMKKFNPITKDGSDWKRFSKEFVELVRVSGADFLAALLYTSDDIPVAPDYPKASVISDTAASAPSLPLPQLRQQLLLSAIKAALDADGEPMRLIKYCKQAGGVVNLTGASPKKQAWQLLVDRYRVSSYIQTSDYAKSLFALQSNWPKEVTPAAWQSFYAEVSDKADRSGFFPQGDDAASDLLRSSWWSVISEPIGASPYWNEIVKLALLAMNYNHRTCIEIEAYYLAVVEQTRYHARTVGARPQVASIRFADGDSVGIDEATALRLRCSLAEETGAVATQQGNVAFGFAAQTARPPFAGSARPPAPPRPCSRCPVLASGMKTVHPQGAGKCQLPALCDVCHSVEHRDHSCFIKLGVPQGVRLDSELIAEITRLHALYKAGTFDWRSTPTTLRWLLKAQMAARNGSTVSAAYGEACNDWSLDGHEEMIAGGVVASALVCEPTTPCPVFRASTFPSAEGMGTWEPMLVRDEGLSDVYHSRSAPRVDAYEAGGRFSQPFGVAARYVEQAEEPGAVEVELGDVSDAEEDQWAQLCFATADDAVCGEAGGAAVASGAAGGAAVPSGLAEAQAAAELRFEATIAEQRAAFEAALAEQRRVGGVGVGVAFSVLLLIALAWATAATPAVKATCGGVAASICAVLALISRVARGQQISCSLFAVAVGLFCFSAHGAQAAPMPTRGRAVRMLAPSAPLRDSPAAAVGSYRMEPWEGSRPAPAWPLQIPPPRLARESAGDAMTLAHGALLQMREPSVLSDVHTSPVQIRGGCRRGEPASRLHGGGEVCGAGAPESRCSSAAGAGGVAGGTADSSGAAGSAAGAGGPAGGAAGASGAAGGAAIASGAAGGATGASGAAGGAAVACGAAGGTADASGAAVASEASGAAVTSGVAVAAAQAQPIVAMCSMGTGVLTGARVAGSHAGLTWARSLPWGWWIIDSGADWSIAGAFIYQYSVVVQYLPMIWVRGVEGESTRVDAIVRLVAGLAGVDWLVQEVLVCNAFTVALWSTEYMAHFGFSAVFGAAGDDSYVRTPSGTRVLLHSRPYRMPATCRVPTPADVVVGAVRKHSSSAQQSYVAGSRAGTCGVSGATTARGVSRAAVASGAAGGAAGASGAVEPMRTPLVSSGKALRMHCLLTHAGWGTVARTFGVRIPAGLTCATCLATKSKRVPHKGHTSEATFAGQRTHADTWGPFCEAFYYRGCRYAVAFVDEYSRFKVVVFCKDRTASTLLAAYRAYVGVMRSYG